MIYYIVGCTYMTYTSYGEPKRIKDIFYRAYKRLANAQKAYEKYKQKALNSDNITLVLYKVDTSKSDELGVYEHEWIAEI